MSSEEAGVFKPTHRDHWKLKALAEKENQIMCVPFGKKKKEVLWKFYDAHKKKNLSNKGQEKNLLMRKVQVK